MTKDKVESVLKKYSSAVPKSSLSDVTEALQHASDECYDDVMKMKKKSVATTILLSIFLGNFAADRFYIQDIELAIVKLVARVLGIALMFVPGYMALGIIFTLIATIWWLADIFSTYRTAKKINLEFLLSFLLAHKENA